MAKLIKMPGSCCIYLFFLKKTNNNNNSNLIPISPGCLQKLQTRKQMRSFCSWYKKATHTSVSCTPIFNPSLFYNSKSHFWVVKNFFLISTSICNWMHQSDARGKSFRHFAFKAQNICCSNSSHFWCRIKPIWSLFRSISWPNVLFSLPYWRRNLCTLLSNVRLFRQRALLDHNPSLLGSPPVTHG